MMCGFTISIAVDDVVVDNVNPLIMVAVYG